MGKDYEMFSEIDGKTAFLIGVTDEIRDNTINSIENYPYPNDFDSDVFFVGENNEYSISDQIKERLFQYLKYSYCDSYGSIEQQKKKISALQLKLKIENIDIITAVENLYNEVKLAVKNRKNIQSYCDQVKSYLGEKINNIYSCEISTKTHDALQLQYNYIINKIIFIEFNKYVLMVTHGSNE